MSSQEKRQINAFGPNCFLETGSNDMGDAGNTAMALCSKNDSDINLIYHNMVVVYHVFIVMVL